MQLTQERRLLQLSVAVAGIVPVVAGLAGAISGVRFVSHAPVDMSLDSHFRYLSGLLLAIGLVFWSLIPHIESRAYLARPLTLIVFVGGLARLFGTLTVGAPPAPMLFGLCMELVVTPALCAWQWRIALLYARKAASPLV